MCHENASFEFSTKVGFYLFPGWLVLSYAKSYSLCFFCYRSAYCDFFYQIYLILILTWYLLSSASHRFYPKKNPKRQNDLHTPPQGQNEKQTSAVGLLLDENMKGEFFFFS